MKLFIKKSLLFTAILFIFLYITDYAVTKGLRKTGDCFEFQEYSTWNNIVSSSIDADVLIMGSSRAYRHINPLIIDTILNCKSFNIGMSGGEDFNKQYIRYMTFEKFNKRPKYIIHQVDYGTLAISDNDFDERFLPYLSDIDKELIDNHLKWVKIHHLKLPLLKYQSQKGQFMQGLFEFFGIKHCPDIRTKGFYATDELWDDTALNQVLQNDSIEAQKEPSAIKLFDSYLNHCKQNNIKLFLVFSPIYYKATDFTKNKKEVLNTYHYFSQKYDFPFLDYSADSLCFDTSYFYNATHLNKEGADIFTLQLAHDILSPDFDTIKK
ncbi:MAG: hypothetical protein FWH18_08455 [Marinilabiliaceae bacterium]|nr:hypothetical protein [Marinilabiliaceae bacterium]